MMETRRHFLQFCSAVSLAPGRSVAESVIQSVPVVNLPKSKPGKTVRLAGAFKEFEESYQLKCINVDDVDLSAHTGTKLEFSVSEKAGLDVCEETRLPGRGHDCVVSPNGQWLVVFSRRPGDWFIAFNSNSDLKDVRIDAQSGRHFYGHGRFSLDGRLFYATENDYERANGTIGIYDVTNSFLRVGEFPSFGVGPHDLVIAHDGAHLVVANGGIETHPDYGREKLNLATMRSSLSIVNLRSGDQSAQREIPESLQRMSIRHIALSGSGDCYFAGQYQGALEDTPPLVGCLRNDGNFQLWDSPLANQLLNNYVTSISVDPYGTTVATTSAKGGAIVFWNASAGEIIAAHHLDDCSGVAANNNYFFVTASSGLHVFSTTGIHLSVLHRKSDTDGSWDNHIAIVGS